MFFCMWCREGELQIESYAKNESIFGSSRLARTSAFISTIEPKQFYSFWSKLGLTISLFCFCLSHQLENWPPWPWFDAVRLQYIYYMHIWNKNTLRKWNFLFLFVLLGLKFNFRHWNYFHVYHLSHIEIKTWNTWT